ATSVRRGCAGKQGPRLRTSPDGTPRRLARRPGTPSCSAPAVMPPENGFCAMTEIPSPPNALPMHRIMAIWLPRLAIDRWRHAEHCRAGEGADTSPTALIEDTAHGPRITAANDSALAAGVKAGMRLADARTLYPALKPIPADP